MAYLNIDPSLDFDAQEMALKQQEARIAALRKMDPRVELQQPEGFRSAVTGASFLAPMTKRPLLNSLQPLIQEQVGVNMERELPGQRSALNARQNEALKQLLAKEIQEPKEAPTVPGYGYAGEEGPEYMPAQGPSPTEKAKYEQDVKAYEQGTLNNLAEMQKIPTVRGLANDRLKDFLLQKPIREEARETKRLAAAQAAEEARRRWQAELDYKRERDEAARGQARELERSRAQSARELKALAASGKGGGERKGSDFVIVKNPDTGDVYNIYKPTGEATLVQGVAGGTSASVQKRANETQDEIEKSTTAISQEKEIKAALDKASANWFFAKGREGLGMFGMESEAQIADNDLVILADPFLKSVPRFEGPQSNDDRKTYERAAGQLANTKLPPGTRRAALDTMIRLHKKHIERMKNKETFTSDAQQRIQDQRGAVPPKTPAAPAAAPAAAGGFSIRLKPGQ